MVRAVKTFALILVIAALGYHFRAPLQGTYARLVTEVAPCRQPIAYRVADFDARFGITEDAFLAAIVEAESVWEKPAGKELFAHEEDGDLGIGLVYDYRQEATEELKGLGTEVEGSRASYDALETDYRAARTRYESLRESYEEKLAAYDRNRIAYEAAVDAWNARGGGSEQERARLEARRAALERQAAAVRSSQDTVNGAAGEANALADALNGLAADLNLAVGRFNEVGASRGEEFSEGLYRSDARGRSIEIYEFGSRTELVRVLAHELGHALGLDHVDDPEAIMYRVNQGKDLVAKPGDLAALAARCGSSAGI